MRIAINIDKLSRTDKRGASVYIYQLIKELSDLDRQNEYFLYTRSDFADKPFLKNPKFSLRIIKTRLGISYWTFIQLPMEAVKDKVDIFFSATQNVPFVFRKPKQISVVTAILDIAYKNYPEYFTFKNRIGLDFNTKMSVKRSDKIVAISESTKKDIIKHYGADPKKIEVIYLSSRMNEAESDWGAAKSGQESAIGTVIKKPYVLFVGAIQPRKNIIRLVEAFEMVREKKKDMNLVICGEKGWMHEEVYRRIKISRFNNSIILTGGVAERDLAALYKHSLMFVLPSLYEGFGIPVLEAMNMGIPVIVPRNSSFPEVAGNSGLYIDEYDKHDIAEKIIMLTDDPGLRARLSALGKAKVKEFSWRECAKKHLILFEDLVNSKK